MIFSIKVVVAKYGMTKKLENLFDLPEISETMTAAQAVEVAQQNQNIINKVNDAIDKIDASLPLVRDLEAGDAELDELAQLAKTKAEDLLDLGMNVDPRFGGVIMQTAGTLLGHAIAAKTAKMDKKLRMISLQLQKARLDYQIEKDKKTTAPEDEAVDGQGIVLDRNALLAQILNKDKSGK
jgi:hypothetical protein